MYHIPLATATLGLRTAAGGLSHNNHASSQNPVISHPPTNLQPQISGHGNFGSLDDDPPAAMRYTECRLAAAAPPLLLDDLDADTVSDRLNTLNVCASVCMWSCAYLQSIALSGTQPEAARLPLRHRAARWTGRPLLTPARRSPLCCPQSCRCSWSTGRRSVGRSLASTDAARPHWHPLCCCRALTRCCARLDGRVVAHAWRSTRPPAAQNPALLNPRASPSASPTRSFTEPFPHQHRRSQTLPRLATTTPTTRRASALASPPRSRPLLNPVVPLPPKPQGIAVGIATKIPPHNLSEVVDGLVALVRDPAISVAALMQHIPGPDFPTGGLFAPGTANSAA